MSDYIKREDATAVIRKTLGSLGNSVITEINSLSGYVTQDYARFTQESTQDLISREDAREAIEDLMDIHFDRQVVLAKARDAIVSLPSAEPKTEMVLCALADKACPFQGQEYAWCLTCPHISEEDRALVKKSVAEPKAGCIPVSDVRKLQDIVWMSIDSLEGTRNIVEAGMLSAWKEVAEYVDGMLGEDGEA